MNRCSSGHAACLLDPVELLETLPARQKDQRANEQAHIDDDRHAYKGPAYHPARMEVVADVEKARRGKRQVVESERQDRESQPGIENQRHPPMLLVGGEHSPRVQDEPP